MLKRAKIAKQPKLTHLIRLTDDFGVWQHCQNGVILREEGYALDDSARALIVYLLYGFNLQAGVCVSYIQNSIKHKKLVGFYNPDRSVQKYPSSEDAAALAYWALSFSVVRKFEQDKALSCIAAIDLDSLRNSSHLRVTSYMLIADCILGRKDTAKLLADKLIANFDSKWNWFEDKMTYANAIFPLALLYYYEHFAESKKSLRQIIVTAISTLERKMRVGVIPCPVGNRQGLGLKDSCRDVYGQQPIDAGFMVIMLAKATEILDRNYAENLNEWTDWFYGNNIMKQSLIDNSYACADGIDEEGISSNQGAESTIMFLWAAYASLHLN